MIIKYFNETVFHFQTELERRYGIKKSTHNLGPIENTSQSQDPGRKGRAKKSKNIHSCRDHDNSSYTNVENLPDSDDDEPLFFVTDSNGDIFSSKNLETEVENYLCYLSELERYCSFFSQVKDGFSGLCFDLYNKTNKTGGSNETEEPFSRRVLDIGFGREFDLDFKYDDNPQVKDYTNFDEIEIFDPRFNRYNENESDDSENQNENEKSNEKGDDSENQNENEKSNEKSDESGESNPNAWMGELWAMCEECAHLNFKRFFLDKMNICEECGSHLPMNSSERIEVFVDPGTWVPMHEDMLSLDFLACLWEEGEYQEEVEEDEKEKEKEENNEQEENKEVEKEENNQEGEGFELVEESELVEEGPLYRLYKHKRASKYKLVFPYKEKEEEENNEQEENKEVEKEENNQEGEGFELVEDYRLIEEAPFYELYEDGEYTYKVNRLEVDYQREAKKEVEKEENNEQEANKEVEKEENNQEGEEYELVREGPLYRLYKHKGEKEEKKQEEEESELVREDPLNGYKLYKINKVEVGCPYKVEVEENNEQEANKEVEKEKNNQEEGEEKDEPYDDRLDLYERDTGIPEAIQTDVGQINGSNSYKINGSNSYKINGFNSYKINGSNSYEINGSNSYEDEEYTYKMNGSKPYEDEECTNGSIGYQKEANKEVEKEENNEQEANKEVEKEENNEQEANKEVEKEKNNQEEEEEKDELYDDRLDRYERDTGLPEAIQTGVGQINGFPVAMGFMDFRFIGGSMGSVVGEKITRLIEYATNQFLPLIIVCASGGARMQEGSLSLMQMGKIARALYDYQSINKLFFVSVLTSPTTGGVTASFGMLGDIIIAEPNATIAFAGKRVIEETLKIEVPEGIQETEFLFEQGAFDLILPRTLFKRVLIEIFWFQDLEPLNTNLMKYSIK